MKICFPRERTRYFVRCLPRRTFIVSSIHAIMMSVAGTMPMSLLAGRFCKQGLCGHLYKEMHISGASLVMLANVWGLDGSFMVPSSQSLLLGHLKNGALMPLGPCQELLEEKSTS